MLRDEVKRLCEAHGPDAFVRKFVEMLGQKKIKPESVSLRALWEGMVGPVEETLSNAHQVGGSLHYVMPRSFGRKEAVSSSAFPIATGALIAAKVIEGFNEQEYIGDKLVTVYPSKMKIDTIPGLTAGEGPLEVLEGQDYEDSTFGEKFVTIEAKKRGRILSVTEESIIFDQTGMVLMKAQRLGAKMRLDRETRILNKVFDVNSDAYKPGNVATALYSAGNKNVVTGNALVDWQNIDACLKIAAAQTDEKGDPILVNPNMLVVPRALWATALRATNATMVRGMDQVNNPQMAQYSASPFAGQFNPLCSPLIDRISTTTWLMGDFKSTFFYKEVFPIQTLASGPGDEDDFEKDIKFRFKVREYGDAGAVEHRYCYKNTP